MEIKTINRDYFQKSKLFLYPTLGIRKGQSVSLIETYVGWDDKIGIDDAKLICLYYLRKDPEFVNFEKTKLLTNRYFKEFFEVEDDRGVYVFDLREYKEDCLHFINGKYSKFSNKLKNLIVNFQPKNTVNYAYVNSFVYPEKYFGIYKTLLNIDLDILVEVGELCSKPDFDKEILHAKIKSLDITSISS
jgi:hypothetical protein